MDIRDAQEEIEFYYTENGKEIVCPVCSAMWLQEEDGEFTLGTCQHLRFTLHSECDDAFEISNEWDANGFLKLVEEARSNDDELHILDILGEIQHSDVSKALFHQWTEDPLNQPWTLWGYKEN